jgi:transcriptional regulator with XRE-family HTH domain
MSAPLPGPYDRDMSPASDLAVGPQLRRWRELRRLSQLALSSATGVSTRHLSCVETGRAKPSRELLLYLADEFEMPKRAANDMLLAAGFAPVFSEYSLDDDALAAARDVIRLVLDGNDPNPTTVIDTRWNVVDANTAAFWFTAGVDPALFTQQLNVARLSLHPDGLASRVTNFDEYAGQLLRHMRHVLVLTQDDELRALIDECETYAPTAARTMPTAPDVVLPLRILIDGVELSFLSTVTTFGTAQDVTLSELSIETLYPADQATRDTLAARPWIDRASDLSAAV